VRGAQAGKPLADLSIPESYRWGSTRGRVRGFLSTMRSCTCGWLKAFAKESPSGQTLMWPSNATSCLT